MQMLKTDLENTLAKRRSVEESVKEIARERRAPFLCPALMDAFIGISRLSTHVLVADD
jgi:deoxyhypusine synthase